ncbi:bactericidal permeability-increasing protein-like isoform X2 [Ambystoma mexicanum]|uniref:bactericidal permeability-increasing protein-like isoform X2 n=1 Tax=Ambystoma mexicanum TaxID=8296 RepID=UPI0037E7ABD7
MSVRVKMAHSVVLGLVMAACASLAETTNPGFIAKITEKGLDYARQEGVATLQKELSKITLPDFSGTFHVKHFGHVHYSFHSLVIRSFQLPNSQISPVPNVGLKLSITDAFIQLDGKWNVHKAALKDHGSFDLKVEGLSIAVVLALGSDSSGRPTISTSDCTSHIHDVRVHISGKLSWLFKLFHDQIDSAFRKALEAKICPVVSESIKTKLQPYLQTLPVTVKIDHIAGIDYSLVGPPATTAESVDLYLKGECFDLSHRSQVPFPPPALAFPADNKLMVYFGISSYLFNTGSLVYQEAGALAFPLTDDMIPKDFKIRLNTSSIGVLIPQVEKLFPDMLMKMMVSAPVAPFLTFTPGNISLSPVLDIQAFAILPNSTMASLFLLSATTTLSAKVAVSANRITGSLILSRLELSLKHSDVGPFSDFLMFAANVQPA